MLGGEVKVKKLDSRAVIPSLGSEHAAGADLYSVLDEDVVPSNLAIVDDYSGTGKTFIKTVNKLMEANGKIAESTKNTLLFVKMNQIYAKEEKEEARCF